MCELVSVIVPVYRAQAYIADTIAMVNEQTYREWELLLIDDCSPDESVRVIRDTLQEYGFGRCRDAGFQEAEGEGQVGRSGEPDTMPHAGERNLQSRTVEQYTDQAGHSVILVRKGMNEGAAAARNTGLDIARGRYIAYLDADDVWRPEKLSRQLDFMRKRQAGFVFTAYEFGDEQAHPTGRIVHVPQELTYRQALSRTVIFTTTVLFDRKVIPDRLLRMPRVESEDTATWWQILRGGYSAYGLDEVLAVYRRPAGSLSSNKFVAIRRIWNLYRRQEQLSVIASIRYFIPWAYRATARRL